MLLNVHGGSRGMNNGDNTAPMNTTGSMDLLDSIRTTTSSSSSPPFRRSNSLSSITTEKSGNTSKQKQEAFESAAAAAASAEQERIVKQQQLQQLQQKGTGGGFLFRRRILNQHNNHLKDPGSDFIRLCNVPGTTIEKNKRPTHYPITKHHHWNQNINTNSQQEQPLQQQPVVYYDPDKLYIEIQSLLRKDPYLIRTIVTNPLGTTGTTTKKGGYNALHVLVSNPTLIKHYKLIQLLVDSSELAFQYENMCNVNLPPNTNNTRNHPFMNRQQQQKENSSVHNSRYGTASSSYHSKRWSSSGSASYHGSSILSDMNGSGGGGGTSLSLLQPKSGQLIREKTLVKGELPLHLVCQQNLIHLASSSTTSSGGGGSTSSTSSSSATDILEYLIRCYPVSVCTPDKIHQNLPIHYACIECTKHYYYPNTTIQDPDLSQQPVSFLSIPIELMILLVQHYPECCKVPNRDGNLPIHLAVQITTLGVPIPTLPPTHQVYYPNNNNTNTNTVPPTTATTTPATVKKPIPTLQQQPTTTTSNNNRIRLFSNFRNNKGSNESHDEDEATTSNTAYEEDDNVVVAESDSSSSSSSSSNYMIPQRTEYYKNQLDIVQYLIDLYPESMNIPNKNGLTPYQLAMLTAFENETKLSTHVIHHNHTNSNNNNNSHTNNDNNNNAHHEVYISTYDITDNPIIQYLKNPTEYLQKTKLEHQLQLQLQQQQQLQQSLLRSTGSTPTTSTTTTNKGNSNGYHQNNGTLFSQIQQQQQNHTLTNSSSHMNSDSTMSSSSTTNPRRKKKSSRSSGSSVSSSRSTSIRKHTSSNSSYSSSSRNRRDEYREKNIMMERTEL